MFRRRKTIIVDPATDEMMRVALSGIFTDSSAIHSQYRTGQMGSEVAFDWFPDTSPVSWWQSMRWLFREAFQRHRVYGN